MAVKSIPEGYHSVTPYLTIQGAATLLDFLKQAFAATEIHCMTRPDGTVGHAEVRLGDQCGAIDSTSQGKLHDNSIVDDPFRLVQQIGVEVATTTTSTSTSTVTLTTGVSTTSTSRKSVGRFACCVARSPPVERTA